MSQAVADGSRPVTTFTQARILALRARADDELTLLTRDEYPAYQADYGVTASTLERALQTPAAGAAEHEELAYASGDFAEYQAVHQVIRHDDHTGELGGAVTFASGTGANDLPAVSNTLDTSLGRGSRRPSRPSWRRHRARRRISTGSSGASAWAHCSPSSWSWWASDHGSGSTDETRRRGWGSVRSFAGHRPRTSTAVLLLATAAVLFGACGSASSDNPAAVGAPDVTPAAGAHRPPESAVGPRHVVREPDGERRAAHNHARTRPHDTRVLHG